MRNIHRHQLLRGQSLAEMAVVIPVLFFLLMGGFDLSIAGFIDASGLLVTQVRERMQISFALALLIAVASAALKAARCSALGAAVPPAGRVCGAFKAGRKRGSGGPDGGGVGRGRG